MPRKAANPDKTAKAEKPVKKQKTQKPVMYKVAVNDEAVIFKHRTAFARKGYVLVHPEELEEMKTMGLVG